MAPFARDPCFAHLDPPNLRRTYRHRVSFEQRQVGELAGLKAADDVVHMALPSCIDRHGTQRGFDREPFVSRKHFAAFVHDAGNSVLDIAERFERRDPPIRVERYAQATSQRRRTGVVEARSLRAEDAVAEGLAPPPYVPNQKRGGESQLTHLGKMLGVHDAAMLDTVPVVYAGGLAQYRLIGFERGVDSGIAVGVHSHL